MKKRFVLLLLLALVVLAPFALSQRLQVTQYVLPGEKLTRDACFAVVSDLHNSVFGENQSELAAAIHAVNPDAVLFTGDMADSLAELAGTCLLVEALDGVYPIYYVSGNHECASGELEAIKSELRTMGVRVLEGESEMLPCGVCIAGADDPQCLYRQEWRDQVAACRSTDDVFTLFLSHRPDRAEYYAEGFDLILSGHAHGGQVRIPGILESGLWAPNQGWFPQYTCGVHDVGEGSMIVSRGLSKGALPRVFNRPELVIVRLEAQM